MDARTKRARVLELDCFLDEHDDRMRGAVDGRFGKMGQHRKIRYDIMLQAQNIAEIGRNQDRQPHVCDESRQFLPGASDGNPEGTCRLQRKSQNKHKKIL
jgi:hypothetical protein